MKPHYLAPFVFLLACSSSESAPAAVPCNEDPWQCAAGQTCWPSDNKGTFACLNSAVGKTKGASCSNAVGTPTCGDGLACLQTSATDGQCLAYCDLTNPGHGCGAGETCTTVTLVGTSAVFHLCVAPPVTKDAGTDSASETGADVGADAAADSTAGDSAATDAASDATAG